MIVVPGWVEYCITVVGDAVAVEYSVVVNSSDVVANCVMVVGVAEIVEWSVIVNESVTVETLVTVC